MSDINTATALAGSRPAAHISDNDMQRAHHTLGVMTAAFQSRVVGQEQLRVAALVTLLAGGHLLLESVPGLAKTTAAQTLASSVRGSYRRIQCTPDLLPSDIVGTQVFDQVKGTFTTQLGPVHANFILLDEINRSSAKTQSAMLEAMQERQTSIGGTVYKLPEPFMVLATQNPIEEEGTYILPEAQMDRFLLKQVIDYPHPAEELEILERIESGTYQHDLAESATVELDDVRYLQQLTKAVYVDRAIKEYIIRIVNGTRKPDHVIGHDLGRYLQFGASPRGEIAFMQVSRAVALLHGRSYVIPEDVKALRYAVLRHRLILTFEATADQMKPETLIDAVFNATPTP